jgi:hypothetical protein
MDDPLPPEALALTVGCRFELDSVQPVPAIMQVAPCPEPGVRIVGERWDTPVDHHGYVDHYGNRCERFELPTGGAQVAYEAQLILTHPADVVAPDALEMPVASLPHEVLSFVMPSRFCPTSASRRRPSRWTSRRGSRPISTAAGTRSTPATTRPASAA